MFALKSFYVCTETIDWIHVILYVKIVTRLLEYWYIKNLVCIYAILYRENWFYSIERIAFSENTIERSGPREIPPKESFVTEN
jgi:hypothetical protein